MGFWTSERVLHELAVCGFYADLTAGRLKATYSELDPVADPDDELALMNVVADELAGRDPGYVSHYERITAAYLDVTSGGRDELRQAHMAIREVNRRYHPRVAQLQFLTTLGSHPTAQALETWYAVQWLLGAVDTVEVGLGDLRRSERRR